MQAREREPIPSESLKYGFLNSDDILMKYAVVYLQSGQEQIIPTSKKRNLKLTH